MTILLRTIILLLCCAIGFVGSGALGWFERPALTHDDLAVAQSRWHVHAPAHYLLRVDEQSLGVACHQEVEVRREQIVAVAVNTCAHPPWTVADLFERIVLDQRHRSSNLAACVVAGCACMRTPSFWAGYDAQLGYPSERHAGVVLANNWLHSDFWWLAIQQHRLPDCSAAIDREVLTVQVLPAPERAAEVERA